MHAFLIIGGTTTDRKRYVETTIAKQGVKSFDIKPLLLTDEALSLGIKSVRTWQKQLLLMPQASPFTAGIIMDAHLLTQEAQNALLKTLEEPPSHTRIYMEAQSDAPFLPTILSRCELVQLPTTPMAIDVSLHMTEDLQILANPKTPPGKALALLDGVIKNKDGAALWVEHAINSLHQRRGAWPKQTYLYLMKQLLLARKHLDANVSYKLVVDTVFLSAKH